MTPSTNRRFRKRSCFCGKRELQQRYAVIDESVVWYGNVDLFAFGRKDAEVLRFVNSDVAGELLGLSQENCEEQMMIEEM